jgi:hypothetical protein
MSTSSTMNTVMSQTIAVPAKRNRVEPALSVDLNGTRALGVRLARVAWLAVLLGISLELVLLLVKTLAGQSTSSAVIAAGMAQKVSWSLIVCVGVAAGQNVSRAIQPLAAGAAGLVASPVAFAAAKGVHMAISSALQIAAPVAGHAAPSPWVIALVKGIEFALLGTLLAWLVTKSWAGFGTYAASGLVTGIVFGTALVAYVSLASDPRPTVVAIVAQALNELIYPVGCASVIYCTSKLGKQFAAA